MQCHVKGRRRRKKLPSCFVLSCPITPKGLNLVQSSNPNPTIRTWLNSDDDEEADDDEGTLWWKRERERERKLQPKWSKSEWFEENPNIKYVYEGCRRTLVKNATTKAVPGRRKGSCWHGLKWWIADFETKCGEGSRRRRRRRHFCVKIELLPTHFFFTRTTIAHLNGLS